MDNGKHVCTLLQEHKCMDLSPTAGCWQRQLCKLRRLMLPCEWHHGAALFIRSRKSLRLERDRQLYGGGWLVCHPYSPIKFYWDCFNIFIIFLGYAYMPFQVFFEYNIGKRSCFILPWTPSRDYDFLEQRLRSLAALRWFRPWTVYLWLFLRFPSDIIDNLGPSPYDPIILFTDLIAFIHVITCFFTGYIGEDNKMIILKPKLIAKHYFRTTFIYDLIAALPLQLIKPFEDCRYPSHTAMFIFKLLRLIPFRQQWKNLLEQSEVTYVTKVWMTVIVQVLMFFHWMTYINYQVPALCVHLYKLDVRLLVWLKRINVVSIEQNSIFQKYTTNLFLVCGLCIGAGYYSPVDEHLIPQMLLTTTMSIIGLIFLTYCFTTLLRLVIYRQFETYLFNGRCTELEQYMTFKRIPMFVQRKIQLFINYKFNGHYFNEASILSTINEQIKQDINMHCCKLLVTNVPLFQDLPIALVNSIVFSMTQLLFMPGETIVKYGQTGDCVHLISSGTVAVMDSAGRELAHLRDGAFFGETSLLHPGTVRAATIVALEITEIYNLNSKDLQTCLQPYPHLKRRMEELVSRRAGRSGRGASRNH